MDDERVRDWRKTMNNLYDYLMEMSEAHNLRLLEGKYDSDKELWIGFGYSNALNEVTNMISDFFADEDFNQ